MAPVRRDVLRHRRVGDQPLRPGQPLREVAGAEPLADLAEVRAVDLPGPPVGLYAPMAWH